MGTNSPMWEADTFTESCGGEEALQVVEVMPVSLSQGHCS